jgi:Tfp pilus assembly protein PilN
MSAPRSRRSILGWGLAIGGMTILIVGLVIITVRLPSAMARQERRRDVVRLEKELAALDAAHAAAGESGALMLRHSDGVGARSDRLRAKIADRERRNQMLTSRARKARREIQEQNSTYPGYGPSSRPSRPKSGRED